MSRNNRIHNNINKLSIAILVLLLAFSAFTTSVFAGTEKAPATTEPAKEKPVVAEEQKVKPFLIKTPWKK